MNRSPDDARWMRRALTRARSAWGRVSPNPAVGAVIVRGGQLAADGATQPPGQAHAEIVALRKAGAEARGGTLYVTLEPCSHFGRTPPCADAILEAGIRRVVCAVPDPNPLVAGGGLRRLREAGLEVEVGLMAPEAVRINEGFFTWIRERRPFVTWKAAVSLDGKTATNTGDSRWISSDASRREVHRMRRRHDAVMIGIGTALRDSPRLTPRCPGPLRSGYPSRIIVDSKARLPLDSPLFDDLPRNPLLVAVGDAAGDRIRRLVERGAVVVTAPSPDGRVDCRNLLDELGRREITSVLLEGGGTLASSLLAEDRIDRVIYYVAPILIGGRDAATALDGKGVETVSLARRLPSLSVTRSGPDLRIEGLLHPPVVDGWPDANSRDAS